MTDLNSNVTEFTNEQGTKQLIYDAAINQGILMTILKKQAEILHYIKNMEGTPDELFSKFQSEALILGEELHEGLPEDWKL